MLFHKPAFFKLLHSVFIALLIVGSVMPVTCKKAAAFGSVLLPLRIIKKGPPIITAAFGVLVFQYETELLLLLCSRLLL